MFHINNYEYFMLIDFLETTILTSVPVIFIEKKISSRPINDGPKL